MKKTSLLLQRPVRTFDDDPTPVASPLQEEPVIHLQPKAAALGDPSAEHTAPPKGAQTLGPENPVPSEKFGPLTVDLAKAKKRVAKGLLTTTVPSYLHYRLMQQEEGPSGFVNKAVEKHLTSSINQVVEAGYRLAALRVAQAEDSRTISARTPMAAVVDVDDAVKYVTKNLEKVSAAFIVGGCVMLLAEEQNLVSAG